MKNKIMFWFSTPILLLLQTSFAGPYLDYLIKHAESGDPDKQFHLAVSLIRGDYLQNDGEEETPNFDRELESVKWFTKAAEQGHAEAQFTLGLIYLEEEGLPEQDLEMAKKWLERACTSGVEEACKQQNLLKENKY